MKPTIFEINPTQVKLVFSKQQLDEVHLSPSRFCDELDKTIEYNVIGFETLKHYECECGVICKKTAIDVTVRNSKGFNATDTQAILNSFKTIIAKHYKKL